MFALKRVLEINGNFIPQTRDSIFDSWQSKDKNDLYTWFTEKNQIEYCSYNSLEEAREALKKIKPIIVRKIHKA